jgi:hypothetical protein
MTILRPGAPLLDPEQPLLQAATTRRLLEVLTAPEGYGPDWTQVRRHWVEWHVRVFVHGGTTRARACALVVDN